MPEKIKREEIMKKVEDAYKLQMKTLKASMREAAEMLRRETGYKAASDVAVATIATIIFSMKMSKEQRLAQIDQMIAIEKLQNAQAKGCAGCPQRKHQHTK